MRVPETSSGRVYALRLGLRARNADRTAAAADAAEHDTVAATGSRGRIGEDAQGFGAGRHWREAHDFAAVAAHVSEAVTLLQTLDGVAARMIELLPAMIALAADATDPALDPAARAGVDATFLHLKDALLAAEAAVPPMPPTASQRPGSAAALQVPLPALRGPSAVVDIAVPTIRLSVVVPGLTTAALDGDEAALGALAALRRAHALAEQSRQAIAAELSRLSSAVLGGAWVAAADVDSEPAVAVRFARQVARDIVKAVDNHRPDGGLLDRSALAVLFRDHGGDGAA